MIFYFYLLDLIETWGFYDPADNNSNKEDDDEKLFFFKSVVPFTNYKDGTV